MTTEFLINALKERGIDAAPFETVKNGVKLKGLNVGNGEIRPCFFEDYYKEFNEAAVNIVIMNILHHFSQPPHISIDDLYKWEYAKTRLMLCLQPKGTENICKRDFLDLEMYVRLVIDTGNAGIATAKINRELLSYYGINEDTLFEVAIKCTEKLICTKSKMEIFKEEGIPEDMLNAIVQQSAPMTAITNIDENFGASAIFFTDILKKIADEYDSDLVIIPGSIHKCLAFPIDEDTDCDEFNYLIEDINSSPFSQEQMLSNHYYLYIRDVNKLFTSRQEYEDFLDEEHREWRYKGDLTCEIDTWFDMLEANQISEEELYHVFLDKGITVDMIREFAGDEKADILQKFRKEN